MPQLTVINGKIDGFVGQSKIYIGRANSGYNLKKSPLANPYHVGKNGDRHTVVEKFGVWLDAEIAKGMKGQYSAAFEELKCIRDRVKTGEKVELACFCKQPGRSVECHGDIVQDRVERMLLFEARRLRRSHQQATEE